MCARIKIKLFVFRTVISRVQLCQISKGCRVSRHPSGVQDHPMNRIRKIYRVDRRQRKLYGMLYRRCLTGYLGRDAGVSWNATPRHYCNVFLHGGSDNLFSSPAFPLCVYKARFHDVKQETCHGLQHLCNICRMKMQSIWISPRSWPRWRKNANVINCYHNVTS